MTFSKQEVNALFNLLESLELIGADEWDKASKEHNKHYRVVEKNGDSLRRKYASLASQRCQTWDLQNFENVCRTKHIKNLIVVWWDIGDATIERTYLGSNVEWLSIKEEIEINTARILSSCQDQAVADTETMTNA